MKKTQIVKDKLVVVLTMIVGFVATNALAGATPWVPMEIRDGHLTVQTEMYGHSGYSVIDTGAQITLINSRFLAATGLDLPTTTPMRIIGINGAELRDTYQSVLVKLLGANLKFNDVPSYRGGSADQQLLIGGSFLESLIFQFDYPNQRMRALTHDMIDMRKSRNVKSRSDRETGEPIVKLTLNGDKDVWVLFDTGNAGGLLLDRRIARRQGWLDENAQEQVLTGAVTSGSFETFNIDTLNLGPYELENPMIVVPKEGQDIQMLKRRTASSGRSARSSGYKGIVGYDVLKHFVFTVDYANGFVHVGLPEE